MFRLLLKKQLYEIFRNWFYNPKTGKSRSRKSTVVMVLLFGLLMVVFLGGSFTAVAIGMIQPLLSAGVGYLYFLLFALIATALGLFGSVFSTYSSLYLSKDNDLLLSLPIPTKIIVFVRLFSTFLIGALYSSVVFLPAAIVYQCVGGFHITSLLGSLVMLFEISLIVWTLSCLLGFFVAKISLKIKSRAAVGVVASLAFMGLYYFVYFKAQVLLEDMARNAVIYSEKIKGSVYVLYLWGNNGTGNFPDMLICLATLITFASLIWILLDKTFLKTATASPKEKSVCIKRKEEKESSLPGALLKKEFSRFTSSANYMLNCGLGILFVPAFGILLLIKGETLLSAFDELQNHFASILPVGLAGIGCMLASMIDTAAASFSLEGKSMWILKSLPIEPWQIIKAKFKMQFLLSEIPMLFFCVCIATLQLSFGDKMLCILFLLLYPLLSALFGIYIGAKMPIFNWTNEIVPIKQSGGVAIVLFGGWIFAFLLVGGYIGLSFLLGSCKTTVYLVAFSFISLLLSLILYRHLKNNSEAILNSL